jgi:hypothetical protein
MPVANSNVLTQDFPSMSLPAQGIMYSDSLARKPKHTKIKKLLRNVWVS